MTKYNMQLKPDAVAREVIHGREQPPAVRTSLEQATAHALSVPFPITGDASTFFAVADDLDGEWEWAVFRNNAPDTSESATMRALLRKVRAAREYDEQSSFDNNWLTGFDLRKKSGEWPDTSIHAFAADDGYATLSVRDRFVLCSTDNMSAGVCTATLSLTTHLDGDPLDAELEIGTVFLDPECRGMGLSYLLAEAAASSMVSMLGELHRRLVSRGLTEVCNVELTVTGECISPGGERFLETTAYQFEQQWYAFLCGASEQVMVNITEIAVLDE
ncbi:hypothetical protein PSAB6_60066 [Paraburkholderia sabiae]|uniref:hypothetical protein n=1 Tax=Paraburkholderia sabiae TaxID=273251 RepID=UPI001CB3B269|nr:hypothetical protein [Paraburkholderia sabiae]CAG9233291.1 hypothetical protein PSAB6_60066 [Paraburkholderia sabiae]